MIEDKKGDFLLCNDDIESVGNSQNNPQQEIWNEHFKEHKGLIGFFIKFHPASFLENEDYYQLLSMKFWDLVQKFEWSRYLPEHGEQTKEQYSKQCTAFCAYVKKSFIRYLGELKDEYDKFGHVLSLDESINGDEELSFIDLIGDMGVANDEAYYLRKLQELKETGIIKGYLIDSINGENDNQIAKKYQCSRGKIRRGIQREIDIMKQVI